MNLVNETNALEGEDRESQLEPIAFGFDHTLSFDLSLEHVLSQASCKPSKVLPLSSTLHELVIALACSRLSDMSSRDNLWPSLGSKLGNGATFQVERREAQGRKLVAVKHIQRDGVGSGQFSYTGLTRKRLDDVLLEVQVLCHLNLLHHENVVELLGYGWEEGPIPYLVLELADLGTLDVFLQEHALSWSQKELTLVQLASGLELLHACGIIHGDIKLENLLVFSKSSQGFVAKFADFGFCIPDTATVGVYHGTRIFNPPEMRSSYYETYASQQNYYLEMADIYSYGLAAWEIAHDGRRFYSVESIGIEPQDVGMALSFLSEMDAANQEILDYAIVFVEDLGLPETLATSFTKVLELALKRDPQSRSSIRDIRRVMDPEDE
jgi:serine/threonine protein kinase